MSSVIISGDTSGAVTVAAPAVSGTNTLTLQAATATNAVNTLGTAVASTSGTSIDFTGLPAWVKRITVMFSGVSTNGTSNYQVQLGNGSVVTSGYLSANTTSNSGGNNLVTATSGIIVSQPDTGATSTIGALTLTLISSNTWIGTGVVYRTSTAATQHMAASLALGGTLDRVRITTVNGTDTFDAGTINILYEG